MSRWFVPFLVRFIETERDRNGTREFCPDPNPQISAIFGRNGTERDKTGSRVSVPMPRKLGHPHRDRTGQDEFAGFVPIYHSTQALRGHPQTTLAIGGLVATGASSISWGWAQKKTPVGSGDRRAPRLGDDKPGTNAVGVENGEKCDLTPDHRFNMYMI